jgi:hypothetical protein
MSEKTLPFVVNDRRKFNAEGELRPDAPPPVEKEKLPEPPVAASPESEASEPEPGSQPETQQPDLPPPPTPEQMEQARLAYTATADRLDIAIRSANPGMDHPPAMSFDTLVQSVYMQAIMQLGGGAQPGQQPQVDILGARQSVDMLDVLADKTAGNLSEQEQVLLDSALFELRLAFLEITQALARSAQARATQNPAGPGAAPGFGAPPAGPRIVR